MICLVIGAMLIGWCLLLVDFFFRSSGYESYRCVLKKDEGNHVPAIPIMKDLRAGAKIDWFYVVEDTPVKVILRSTFFDKYISVDIKIKKGYSSNFASVPRALWAIIPPHGRSAPAAIVHDYLYEHMRHEDKDKNRTVRYVHDSVFLFILLCSKLPMWQCVLMYYYVRAFGWVKFKTKDKTEDISPS